MSTPIDTASLLREARTVSGNNLKGSVRIVSAAEMDAFLGREKARLDAEVQAQIAKAQAAEAAAVAAGKAAEAAAAAAIKAQVAEREAALKAQQAQGEAALKSRIAELEAALKAAAADKEQAVYKAKGDMAARIHELEQIIAKDDHRARVKFLEDEVARLLTMVDRYESGLEFITAIENPQITQDLALAEELGRRTKGPLNARILQIQERLTSAGRRVSEGVPLIVGQQKGTIYTVADLVEQAVSLTHLHEELLSINQALG